MVMAGDVGEMREQALVGRASWLGFQWNFDDGLLEAVIVEEWLRVGFWMDV